MARALRIGVIGGGIVGLATALRLQQSDPLNDLTLLEKERRVGMHQSTHNSGVLHAGLYYRPGSAKAKLAVEGIRQMIAFCAMHSIPHEVCGKLVVATTADEVGRLRALQARGGENGLRGLRWLERAEMLEIEPHVGGLAGLHVPEEGIVDYRAVCDAMQAEIERAGGKVRTGAKVTAIARDGSGWRITSTSGEFGFDFIVNCAGLFCDCIAAKAGEDAPAQIIPFRGEYFALREEARHLVRHLIYPVPDPAFPFLGVHFTRLIHGGVEAGPNAVLALAREGYKRSDVQPAELLRSLAFPGLWRFLARHARMSWFELQRSCSRRLFCASLQRLVPDVREEDLGEGGSGVRAQAMSPDGRLVEDFAFIERPNALHVINAPSPAATASLAIGAQIAATVSRLAGRPASIS